MNSVQSHLIDFLSFSIQGKKTSAKNISKKDLHWLIKEVKAHNIQGLVYCGIDNIQYLESIDKELIDSCRKDVFVGGILQIQHINQLKKVFLEFNNNRIPVIALKGIFLRNFYPRPEQRTMCDADILVHKEDLQRVRELLTRLGYTESEDSTPAHISFQHERYLPIEVHWSLFDSRYFRTASMLQDEVWQRAEIKQIDEVQVLSLCPEDFLLHLCVHMAIHMRSSGFGLRQLCDVTQFIRAARWSIDWPHFQKIIKESNIERFCLSILKACEKLFHLDLPSELDFCDKIDKKYINILISDIFSSGVHGNRSMYQTFGNTLLNSNVVFGEKSPVKINSILKIIFPPANVLSHSYSYAKKCKPLLPVAWVHHLLAGIFNKRYSIIDKLSFLLLSDLTFKRRLKLIKALDLQK
ncbi:nucleotidyltransferase domain-containing protein [Clostridium thermarum]|uniref:nucleotidyltransferase domain-containing protein n=1 Tax=Clostridium thermarum TaxID=1716543 RepID=UPI0013D4930F|nr:nucleotidyltransferase family protein [Clostridium thermarum]